MCHGSGGLDKKTDQQVEFGKFVLFLGFVNTWKDAIALLLAMISLCISLFLFIQSIWVSDANLKFLCYSVGSHYYLSVENSGDKPGGLLRHGEIRDAHGKLLAKIDIINQAGPKENNLISGNSATQVLILIKDRDIPDLETATKAYLMVYYFTYTQKITQKKIDMKR